MMYFTMLVLVREELIMNNRNLCLLRLYTFCKQVNAVCFGNSNNVSCEYLGYFFNMR